MLNDVKKEFDIELPEEMFGACGVLAWADDLQTAI